MSPEEIVAVESTKIAIKRILKDLKDSGGLSNYQMAGILSDILCDYRSEASYDYIVAQLTVSQQTSEQDTTT